MITRTAFLAKAAAYGLFCVAAGNVTHEPIKRAIARIHHHAPAKPHHIKPATVPCEPAAVAATPRVPDVALDAFDTTQVQHRGMEPELATGFPRVPAVTGVSVGPAGPYVPLPPGPGPIVTPPVVTPPPIPLPEPSTWVLMIGGFGAVGGVLRRVGKKEAKA